MGKREENKAQTRSRIIETAMGLFSEYGYDKVTLSQIAKACHISTGTLYNYFNCKSDIVFADLLKSHDELLAEFETMPDDEPLNRIKETALSVFRHYTRDSDIGLGVKIFLVSSEEYNSRFYEAQESIFANLLERAKGAGEIRPDVNCAMAADIINTVLNNEMGRTLYSQETNNAYEADLENKIDMIFDGLRN